MLGDPRSNSTGTILTGGVVMLFVGLFVILSVSPYVGLLKLAYPGAALVVGLLLYAFQPSMYLGFVWWIWFVTPFARRVLDYQLNQYDPLNPVMLAPLLVTGLSVLTFLRNGARLNQRMYFPFLLAILGVVYGYLVGVVKVGVVAATFALLEWMLPVVFGFHILLQWSRYPQHRAAVRQAFVWGVLVMGGYGIVQFFQPPPWDAFWMTWSGLSSIGKPEPFLVRVFSTLNAPGPFAMVMLAGLMVLFDGRGLFSRLAAAPGYVGFLLSLVRGAWGGWVVAVGYVMLRSTGRMRVRLAVLLAAGIVLSIPLLMRGPISDRVGGRVDTLRDLGGDRSFNARQDLYEVRAARALLNPVGEGLGSLGRAAKLRTGEVVSFDSGVLSIPFTLGWPGTAMFIGGLAWMMLKALKIREDDADQFVVIATSIAFAYVILLVFANFLIGIHGTVVWSFLGLALAGKMYYDELSYYEADYEEEGFLDEEQAYAQEWSYVHRTG